MKICLGFDGSETDDWTAIKAETIDGLLFTPTYGPDSRPTIWSPAEWNGRIPVAEVNTAVDELFATHQVKRMYCDPRGWQTEIDNWSLKHGDEIVFEWATGRITQMHAALDRFVTDLRSGALTHDGCKTTTVHVGNAKKLAKPGDKYILGKPNQQQKIDAAVASVICHEAAADARADGWATETKEYVYYG